MLHTLNSHMLYVNYISIKLKKKLLKKKENYLSLVSFEPIKSLGGHGPLLQIQVLPSWGRRRPAYSLAAWPKLSALAPAAEGNVTHLHQCQEGLVPAYTHFILRSGLDEEITEDFFFSPNLFPLFHCVFKTIVGC